MKTPYIVWTAAAVTGSLGALWYLLAEWLRVPIGGVLIVLLPTTLVTVLASIYGYHVGAKRRRARVRGVALSGGFSPWYLFGFAIIALFGGVVDLRLALLGRSMAAVGLAILLTAVLIAGVFVGRQRMLAGIVEPASTADETFEHHFRLFVFGLVLAVPIALMMIFLLWIRDVEEAVVFLVISAVAAPWGIHKIRQSRDRKVRR